MGVGETSIKFFARKETVGDAKEGFGEAVALSGRAGAARVGGGCCRGVVRVLAGLTVVCPSAFAIDFTRDSGEA